ncbi:MFS transporter [Megasphaera paucivorans]|uniref:MFS transporter, putative metabolite:H+ symporter n=1 Tax=Megasphaera paucivorans TaxID=349095 RepID=A0A1H0ALY9_9FIRM|nr:MFS transporter [Megasphaera paucivorans]SDN34381.1 MFS transporter, putative metabolite:H+ symporter [Megasphaera paucivorans]
MEGSKNIGARLDRLPISNWHYEILVLIGLGMFIDSFDNYMGGAVLSELIKTGWSTNYLNAVFISTTMAGLFLGSIFAGLAGDHLGRKFAYQLNLLIFGIAAIAATFVTSMTLLIILRGIMGIGLGAELVVGFGTFSEFVPARVRGRWTSFLSLVANCGPPVALIAAYFIIPIFTWRAMFLIGGISALIVWMLRHNLPESPRWYESRGEYEKADIIVSKVEKSIERTTGKKLSKVLEMDETNIPLIRQISIWSLFHGVLLKRTIVSSAVLIGMNTLIYTVVNWVPTIFIQQGLSITKSIGMVALMLIGAPIGVFIASRTVDRFPRKIMTSSLLLIIGVLGYVYSLQRDEVIIVALGFILIIFIYIYTCLVCSVYVPEMWPTEARLRGTGVANAVGRISAIFSPYIVAWLLTNYGVTAVFIGLGIVVIVLAVVIMVLGVETRHKTLEEISMEIEEEFDASVTNYSKN